VALREQRNHREFSDSINASAWREEPAQNSEAAQAEEQVTVGQAESGSRSVGKQERGILQERMPCVLYKGKVVRWGGSGGGGGGRNYGMGGHDTTSSLEVRHHTTAPTRPTTHKRDPPRRGTQGKKKNKKKRKDTEVPQRPQPTRRPELQNTGTGERPNKDFTGVSAGQVGC